MHCQPPHTTSSQGRTDSSGDGVLLQHLQELYFREATDLSEKSVYRCGAELQRWLKSGLPSDARSVRKEDFARFREIGSTSWSPVSIECTVNEVKKLIKFAHTEGMIDSIPSIGRRLKRKTRVKYIPPVDHIGLLFGASEGAIKTLVAVAYTTALRLGDMLSLRYENFEWERQLLRVAASKTSKVQTLPLLSCVVRTLPTDRAAGPVFDLRPWDAQRGMARACKRLGIPVITPQAIRRTSANAYEHARPGAGSVILGHAVAGASGFYLFVPEILRLAATSLELPVQMRTV